ncbi:hypothetical protein GQR99_20885 (plasmid) [Cereibacter sphaeroides]|nr:hypothetical protein GQR99_20885 [Cereibacter sphaeroides]GEM95457.1 hypothetical protein RSP03_45240 [Cereibacter sphaeroides]
MEHGFPGILVSLALNVGHDGSRHSRLLELREGRARAYPALVARGRQDDITTG